MEIITIASIALGVLMLVGFFLGILRSWKKSLIRFAFIVGSFLGALLLSSTFSKWLMSRYVNGLVLSIFGKTIDFEELAGELAGDLVSEGSALTNFATALINIVIKIASFLIIFLALFILTLIIYFIISIIMSVNEKKNSVGDVTVRWWERFIGAGIGVISTLVMCMVLFCPIFGVMNICDKFLADESKNSASAYNETSFIAGKFYTDNDKIGKVEGYLEKYDNLRREYKKSFAGYVFTYTGVDSIGKIVFNNVSTVNQNGVKVVFTEECVNIVNVYNIYKTNFIEDSFNLSKDESVDALEDIYEIARNSEVLKTFIVDLVPKMANKWTNGEKFLNMSMPVNGDTKEIVVDFLKVFDTKEFAVIDRNIDAMFKSIRVANKYEVIASINQGKEFIDVIDRDGFVKDEINALATTPEFRRALPNVMTTMVKFAYKSALEDPGTKLDQEFTQEELSKIVWTREADLTQEIITRMFRFFDTEDVIDCLSDFGVVIDSARESAILSKPVKILMLDYIDKIGADLGSAKDTIKNAIANEWDSENYSFEDLFSTVEITAKVAKDMSSMELTDLRETIENLFKNDSEGKVETTIREAIDDGILNTLIGDSTKAQVYEDMILGILDKEDTTSIDKDLQAGQAIVNIINSPATSNKSVLDNYGNEGVSDEDKAELVIESLIVSEPIMEILSTEADKVDGGHQSDIKNYIDKLSPTDKNLLNSAAGKVANEDMRKTLLTLFGN